MPSLLTRREAFKGATLLAAAPVGEVDPAILRRHDALVRDLLERQVTAPSSRWCGACPGPYGLHEAGSAAAVLETFTAAFLHPGSRFCGDRLLVERMRLAAGYLEKAQNAEGFIDLLITNFNSPPDTAFVVQPVATAACLARRRGETELAGLSDRFLRRAAAGLVRGGVHTPNHRWVVCAALAQLYELYRDPACLRRIDQWLAEGIDIDSDGQYTERSTLVYNPVVDRALIVMAVKLRRPELLDPVRRNLNSMLYLLHPDYEVVTEISHRQDQYQRGDIGAYWFPLKYMAVRDNDGRFAALARRFAAQHARLGALMEYPELLAPGPADAEIPDDYLKDFPALGITRIRRGLTSATLMLGGNSRFFCLRRGQAVVEAVRFASAFFGKGQFIPQEVRRQGEVYAFSQTLEGDYLQPLEPAGRVGPSEWAAVRARRKRSQSCRLIQRAELAEHPEGFKLRVRVYGTDNVPVAIEIHLREGGRLEGVEPAPGVSDAWLLAGPQALYQAGGDVIRFGPGLREHGYTQVRGAEPKLPGPSVYLTGYTPLDHTIEFSWKRG